MALRSTPKPQLTARNLVGGPVDAHIGRFGDAHLRGDPTTLGDGMRSRANHTCRLISTSPASISAMPNLSGRVKDSLSRRRETR